MSEHMRNSWRVVSAIGVGAILMYLFDPQTGRRRRAMMQHRVIRLAHRAEDAVGTVWRDARNRGRGLAAEASSFVRRKPVSDAVLVERVRAKLGSLIRHPSSIHVSADHGEVTLRGPVLSQEADRLLEGVARVNGVAGVLDLLDLHRRPGDVPGLQGASAPVAGGETFELMQENWSPTARVAVGLTGAASALYGAFRRDLAGAGAALIGIAAAARSSLNIPFKRIVGIEAGHRAVDINKTVRVAAPLERVFRFWADYKEFPRYTSHVREVVEQGEGASRWTVVGPAGVTFSWDAVVTRFIPEKEIAWRTESNSSVRHAGSVKFADNRDGTTTMHVRISYNPPGGVMGHGIAALFGSDLKTLLEEDWQRIKTVLETGRIPSDVQQRTVPESRAA